jgi:hypothetical protein
MTRLSHTLVSRRPSAMTRGFWLDQRTGPLPKRKPPDSAAITHEMERNYEKLAALKGGLSRNLAKVRQAANANKDERDRAIAEHVNSYISEVGNDGELADAFLTWVERS